MCSVLDILKEMDYYYSIILDDCSESSRKRYYGVKMIELIENYPEIKDYWKYHCNQYCWKDRFEKLKTLSSAEEKKLNKTPILPTFYIYFAHHWDFNSRYGWKTIKEVKEYYTKSGESEKDVKETCRWYLETKIGLTATLDQRNGQLYDSEGLEIKQYFSFRGNYNQALWMESQIRLYIEQHYSSFNCSHYGNDHFHCTNTNIIRHIDKTFISVCEKMFQQMTLVK